MFKAAVILSLVLNLCFAGAIGAFYFLRNDDAKFVASYVQMTPEQREVIRSANDTVGRLSIESQKQFDELLLNDSFRARFADLGTPEAVQELLVESTRTAIANQDRRMSEEQAAIERFKMRSGEYRDFERSLSDREAALAAERETLERERTAWESLQVNAHLNQLVQDINKADRKYAPLAARLTGLPTIQQAYVLRSVTVPQARTEIEAALPAEEAAALKAFNARHGSSDLGAVMGAAASNR